MRQSRPLCDGETLIFEERFRRAGELRSRHDRFVAFEMLSDVASYRHISSISAAPLLEVRIVEGVEGVPGEKEEESGRESILDSSGG